ncbi:MAG TPA: ATP synthase subunit C [Oscillospiraceae bacterium]|jgi:V/A-type H+-transporting ATPase subunit K|nr:ATP synthase subunit C [Oscillospiraceae bacterium]
MEITKIIEIVLLPLAIVIMLFMPLIPIVRGVKTGKKAKNAIIFNLCSFFAVIALAIILPVGQLMGFAATDAADAVANSTRGMAYLSAAIVTGLACIGCGVAVAGAAPAAIGAVAEEPKSFVKSLIFVALGEGVAIYGVLIAILILFV